MEIETRNEVVQLPGKEVIIRVAKNFDALCTDPEDDDKIPYWADIWPAARAMAL